VRRSEHPDPARSRSGTFREIAVQIRVPSSSLGDHGESLKTTMRTGDFQRL